MPNHAGIYKLALARKGAVRQYVAAFNPATQHWLRADKPAASNIGWGSYILPHDDSGAEWKITAVTPR